MTHPKEYSLWIIPPEGIFEKLAAIISRLSKQHATPSFEPHVTLLGDISLPEEKVLSKTSELASLFSPFPLRLTTVGYLSAYFRSLFINVEKTEKIMEVQQKARTLFHRESDPAFFPHLSLMYGDFLAETKEGIISEIGADFHLTFEVSSIHLVLCSSNIVPDNWRKLRPFILQSCAY